MTMAQKLTGIIMYVILSSIDKKEPHGKRGRKAILKGVKKKLTIEGVKDPVDYLALVDEAYVIMDLAKKNLTKTNLKLTQVPL